MWADVLSTISSQVTPWSTHPSDGLVKYPLHVRQLTPRRQAYGPEGSKSRQDQGARGAWEVS